MKIKVSLTRMELLRLRKRFELAKRGHKLLEDKLEGLVARFLKMAAEYQKQHQKVSDEFPLVLQSFVLAESLSSKDSIESALMECRGETDIEITHERVMNVPVPRLEVKDFRVDLSYSLVNAPQALDRGVEEIRTLLPEILNLAALQESVRILALEIAKTRRRVNSLRYIILPQLEESIKQISMRLEELDRERKSQLLKIKHMQGK